MRLGTMEVIGFNNPEVRNMNQRLQDLLDNNGDNYILPFFWQHGEDEAVLREEMARIDESGIGAVCIEARPHPDFAGPGWWHDMDIIFDEARTRGMEVWILDDAHFPTGFANNALKNKPDNLRKQYVMFKNIDASGPVAGARLDVDALARTVPMPSFGTPSPFAPKDQVTFNDDQLLGVVAARILPDDRLDTSSFINLTSLVKDGRLHWDIPAGQWRTFVLYLTRNGGGNTNYINMIDRDSCAVQIEAVYEPHYAHYAADFGKTFAGFFSDEPLIGNCTGFEFNESIGRKMMPLPWSAEMPDLMTQNMGANWLELLPLLWFAGDAADRKTAQTRYAYMDVITRLIEKNFSRQIGEWCSDHGVEYIGHLIEDNNQHSRLGSSLGHFFRGLAGQHMSGIDDIGGQVMPGFENSMRHRRILSSGDGEFYHFALGKLGSSLGHIDPLKKGRTMCEIFGAYGWGEGVRMMKWLTDHFLVRGVNYYVPHAFSAKEFPDQDCPPHFYARGQNPQFRHFGQLMRYMNRMCHLLNGGKCIAPAAILYHGESEWTGKTMFLQKPARVLTENQIDFDILPSDVFADTAAFKTCLVNNILTVNGNDYRCLIIPTAEYITSAVADFAVQAMAAGFPVIFIDELPVGICDGLMSGAKLPGNLCECSVSSLQELPALLQNLGIRDIKLSAASNSMRYMHYRHDDSASQNTDLWMFFNESLSETIDVWVELPVKGQACFYDAEKNIRYGAQQQSTADGSKVQIVLAPYESSVLVFGSEDSGVQPVRKPLHELKSVQTVTGPWTIALANATEYPDFRDGHQSDELYDISSKNPLFSGTIRYETGLTIGAAPAAGSELVIGEANEAVEVWVNDQYAGMRLCPPYRFPIGELLQQGSNQLRIEVTNTLENQMKTNVSPMMALFSSGSFEVPVGLTGKVEIKA